MYKLKKLRVVKTKLHSYCGVRKKSTIQFAATKFLHPVTSLLKLILYLYSILFQCTSFFSVFINLFSTTLGHVKVGRRAVCVRGRLLHRWGKLTYDGGKPQRATYVLPQGPGQKDYGRRRQRLQQPQRLSVALKRQFSW